MKLDQAVIWRFIRVFVATFIVYLGVHLPQVQKGTGDELVHVVLVPALVGAIVALGKAIRDAYPDITKYLPF